MYYMILSSKKMTSWKKLAELITVPYNIPHYYCVVAKRMVRTTINLSSRYFTTLYCMIHQRRGENAPRGLQIKRARDDFVCRLFNPPQASLLLRDKDDRSPNLPSAISEECNDNNCIYLSSNHHIFLNRLKNFPPPRLSRLHRDCKIHYWPTSIIEATVFKFWSFR